MLRKRRHQRLHCECIQGSPHPANIAERPRPLRPDADALLNVGRRSPCARAASAWWRRLRARHAFPRTDGFDDNIYSGDRAVDLALHAFDLGLQELLHLLKLESQLVKFVYRVRGQPGDGRVESFGADLNGPEGLDFSLPGCVATACSDEGVFSSSAADGGVSISSSLGARGPLQ